MVRDVLLSRAVAGFAANSEFSRSRVPLTANHFTFLRVRGMTFTTIGIPASNFMRNAIIRWLQERSRPRYPLLRFIQKYKRQNGQSTSHADGKPIDLHVMRTGRHHNGSLNAL